MSDQDLSHFFPDGMAQKILDQDVADGIRFMSDVYKAFKAQGLEPRAALEMAKLMLGGAIDEEPQE